MFKNVLKGALSVTKRALAIASLLLLVWVAPGSAWFPEWWYRFFWNAGLADGDYWKDALRYLVDSEPVLLIGVCIGVALTAALARHYWHRIAPALDRWAFQVTIVCVLAIPADALILHGQLAGRMEAQDDIERVSSILQAEEADRGWTPPAIEPPVDFLYLDRDRVSALYSELEAEFPEKERTVSSERSGAVTLGAAGSNAELSGKATQTTSFQRQNLSPERKCIDLLNTLLPKWKIPYYTTADDWRQHEFEHLQRVLRTASTTSATLMADEAIVLSGRKDARGRDMAEPFAKLYDQALKELAKPQNAELVKKELAPAVERNLRSEMARLSGLVLLEGTFRRVSGQAELFEETFGYAPQRVLFRFSPPKRQSPEPIADGSHLRVFGNVVQQLNAGNHVDILPIAIF